MFTVRALQLGDIEQTVALLKGSWERTYDPLIGKETRIQISDEKHKPQKLREEMEDVNGEALVAIDEAGDVIGHVGGEIRGGAKTFFVDRLHVEPVYFGKGVAVKLMDELCAALKDRANSIELTVLHGNDRAEAFYLKYGFKVSTGENEDDGLGLIKSTLLRYEIDE